MVQFNLLPDIKIEYLKAKRQKHMVVLISVIAVAVGLAFVLFMFTVVHVLQKKNISDLKKDIKSSSDELRATPELTKVLTVQNQLKALPALHDEKSVSSRLFTYLSQVTPSSASIAKLNVDFANNSMSLSGSADGLTTVNTFVDTLKFTKYSDSESGDSDNKNAFSGIVLANFSRDNETATYTINLTFDPLIFSETADTKLVVPSITTTRSQVAKPAALFQEGGEE